MTSAQYGVNQQGTPRQTMLWLDASGETSPDLEPATKTIVAVAKPALPDYSYTNSLDAGFRNRATNTFDARVKLKNVAVDLTVTIDSFNAGCTTLFYSVDIGGLIPFTGSFAAIGAQTNYGNFTTTDFSDIANLLAGIYFWVDAGNAVLSRVTLSLIYGYYGALATTYVEVYRVTGVRGLVTVNARCYRNISGNTSFAWANYRLWSYWGTTYGLYSNRESFNNNYSGTSFYHTDPLGFSHIQRAPTAGNITFNGTMIFQFIEW